LANRFEVNPDFLALAKKASCFHLGSMATRIDDELRVTFADSARDALAGRTNVGNSYTATGCANLGSPYMESALIVNQSAYNMTMA
jgi:hypothetical protein